MVKRVTTTMDPSIWKKVKEMARLRGITLAAAVDTAFRNWLRSMAEGGQ